MNTYIYKDKEYICPLSLTLDVIGGKWKILILWHLNIETLRFSDLQRILPKISKKVMTSALRELENDKLIIRKIYPEIPPKVEYSISILGKELLPAIYTLGLFGKKISSNSN